MSGLESAMSIEHKAMTALKWATVAKIAVQILSWAGTLVVVRLLTPQDYGLMAKVAVVCAIAGAVAELGLETALVRAQEIARDDLRKIYGVALLFATAITASLVLASPLLARLFQEPRLTWPVAAASLQILIGAVAMVPSAMAVRELAFKRLAQIEMAAGVTGITATVLLALLGAGVWALVLGTLGGAVVRSAALLALANGVPPRFSARGIGEQLKFGLTVVGNRVSYFIVVQSDVLIGSAFLTTVEIGRYAVALQLATLPMSKVMGTINQIALPAVSRQQDDPSRVRQGVLRAVGVISLVAFPALWAISALARELVLVLFGPKWLETVPALMILPIIVPMRMVFSVLFTTSLALGNRQLDLRNTIANFVLLPSGFFVGAHWGLVGLCSAWLVSVPLAYAVSVPRVLQFIGIAASELIRECGAPAGAAMVMVATIAVLRPLVATWPPIATLLVLAGAGLSVYLAAIALMSRHHLTEARLFARSLLKRDAGEIAA
jgi:O-antigen/teichoic acid export membrane protein